MIIYNFAILILINCLSIISIKCNCGPPGNPLGANIYDNPPQSQENRTYSYECDDSLWRVYSSFRTCIKGKWMETIPKCAFRMNDKLFISKYRIDYFDNTSRERNLVNITLNELNLDFIEIKASKNWNLTLFYLPLSRISYIEITIERKLMSETDNIENNLITDIFINKYRDCIPSGKNINAFHFSFACELKSAESYLNETEDLPNSIKLSFISKNVTKLKSVTISVFTFQDGCGTPDIPLNANAQPGGKTVLFYPSNQEKYEIIGKDTIECLFEGNWDKDPPLIKPKIICETEDLGLNSSAFKSIEFKNFEYFNQTNVAVIDSTIKYQCNYAENSSNVFLLSCNQNGLWIGDKNMCQNTSKITANEEPINRSNLLLIIITLFSTFVSTLIIGLIFGIIVWRRKKLKIKQKSKSKDTTFEGYDDNINENDYDNYDYDHVNYEKTVYEGINYDQLNIGKNESSDYYLELN